MQNYFQASEEERQKSEGEESHWDLDENWVCAVWVRFVVGVSGISGNLGVGASGSICELIPVVRGVWASVGLSDEVSIEFCVWVETAVVIIDSLAGGIVSFGASIVWDDAWALWAASCGWWSTGWCAWALWGWRAGGSNGWSNQEGEGDGSNELVHLEFNIISHVLLLTTNFN